MGQILNISVKKLLPKVTLLSAGDTQQVVCTPMVYLTATISGDLNRHTTEWEQISGSPQVTIISIDSLNAYYTVGSPAGTDKVFRFWIDKGRNYAQYADVIIRTTPTDEIYVDLNYGNLPNFITTRDSFKVAETLIMGNLVFDETIPFNSAGDTFTNNLIISWSLPKLFKETLDSETQRYSNNFLGTTLQAFVVSSWQDLLTTPINGIREYVLPSNVDKLRINSNYWFNGQVLSIAGDWFTLDTATLKVITAKESIPDVKISSVNNDTAITRLIYTLNLLTYDTTINDEMVTTPVNNQTSVSQIVYLLLPVTYDTTIDPLQTTAPVNLTYSITRVTTGTIGG